MELKKNGNKICTLNFVLIIKYGGSLPGTVVNVLEKIWTHWGSIPGRVIPKTLKNGTWYVLA